LVKVNFEIYYLFHLYFFNIFLKSIKKTKKDNFVALFKKFCKFPQLLRKQLKTLIKLLFKTSTDGDRYPHFSYPHNQGGTKWLI